MSDMHVEIRHDQKIVWVHKAGRAIASFAFEEFGGDGKAFDAAMAFVERGADDAPLTAAEAMARCPEVAAAFRALQSAQESIATFMGVHGYPKDSGAGLVLDEVSAALAAFTKS